MAVLVFGRRASESLVTPKPSARSEPTPQQGTACGSLSRVLARVLKEPKPEILILGPLCGASVVYLAGRGARVTVEDFDPPPPTPPRQPGEAPVEKVPLRFEQPDGMYHLVLGWELSDFVPADRLADYGAELRRVTRDTGWVLLFSSSKLDSERGPLSRYRVLADDLVVREVCDVPPRPRYVHPTRDIERALAGFAVQGIHLQRNQTREILALKSGVGG